MLISKWKKKDHIVNKKKRNKRAHSGEGVAGVGDQQTGFAHSSVPNSDALDEPRSAHLLPLLLLPFLFTSTSKEKRKPQPDLPPEDPDHSPTHTHNTLPTSPPQFFASITHLYEVKNENRDTSMNEKIGKILILILIIIKTTTENDARNELETLIGKWTRGWGEFGEEEKNEKP